MHYFSIFPKNLTNHALIFRAFGRKTQIVGKFEKFSNVFENFRKIHYFSIFFEKFNKPCVNFSRVWTKTTIFWKILEILKIFYENSIEKLNFYLFLGNVVAKNRAFGNNIIFLLQFFPVWGFNQPPCVRHWSNALFLRAQQMATE